METKCPCCETTKCPVSCPNYRTPEQERMNRAFELVCPTKFGGTDWRSPINAFVAEKELTETGVTLDEVKEAVAFMTATEAHVSVPISMAEGGIGYLVRAKGYRAGPAGP